MTEKKQLEHKIKMMARRLERIRAQKQREMTRLKELETEVKMLRWQQEELMA